MGASWSTPPVPSPQDRLEIVAAARRKRAERDRAYVEETQARAAAQALAALRTCTDRLRTDGRNPLPCWAEEEDAANIMARALRDAGYTVSGPRESMPLDRAAARELQAIAGRTRVATEVTFGGYDYPSYTATAYPPSAFCIHVQVPDRA